MSISARFEADFASFQSAVKNAETSLKSFETGAGRVETSLNKMVDSLSGRRLVQDATLMAEAVDRIGGVSKLSTSELERMSSKATEAVAKMKALGVDVPVGLQKIADHSKLTSVQLDAMGSTAIRANTTITDHTNRANSAQAAMISTAKNLAATLGLTFSVSTVVAWTKEILSASDTLVKVSDRTGLTIEEVQRLSFVAQQSGNSLDQLTAAVGKMQVNLNDPKSQASLRALNVDLAALRSAGPYESLRLIAEGFGGIKDPVKQAEAAVAIFGKSGLEILPTLKAEFDKLANGVTVASAAQVRALDDAGDALDRFKTRVTNFSIGAAGNFAIVAEKIGVFKTVLLGLAPSIGGLNPSIAELAESFTKLGRSVENVDLPKQINPLVEYRKHLAELRRESVDLTDTQKVLIQQGHDLGESNSAIAAGLGNISETAVAAYLKMIEGSKKATEETNKLREAEKKLFEEIRLWGIHQLREMTKEVDAELRKQMDLMGAAAAQLFTLQQEGSKRLSSLFDAAPVSGMEAEIAKLDTRFQEYGTTLDRLASQAGPAWANTVQQIRNQMSIEYDRTFTDIITKGAQFNNDLASKVAEGGAQLGAAASVSVVPMVNAFVGAFGQIESRAVSAFERVSQLLAIDDAYRKAGIFVNDTSPTLTALRTGPFTGPGKGPMPTSGGISIGAINVTGGATRADGTAAANGFVDAMKSKGYQL